VSERVDVSMVLNGEPRRFTVPPGRRLLDLLRDDAGLTGTKEGCGAGECGACTVLLDGKPVPSCMVMAASCDGHEVVSVEGLAGGGRLHPFQEAMVHEGGVQCGYCTPGIVVTGAAIIAAGERRESEWARLLAGNLCRCTGYRKIFAALAAASEAPHA
jgi:aerobic carbon-monoxide dehydrogenase small subunit